MMSVGQMPAWRRPPVRQRGWHAPHDHGAQVKGVASTHSLMVTSTMEREADASTSQLGASPSKRPRVLWRGSLILHDGTCLPGASIVTSMHPWAHLHTSEHAATGALEAEAELCLALEMVRHHALCVRSTDSQTTESSVADASGAIQL